MATAEKSSQRLSRSARRGFGGPLALFFALICSISGAAEAQTDVPGGERAVKFIMKADNPGFYTGSFDAPTYGSDGLAAGLGHKAVRPFTPGDSMIVNADIAAWPDSVKWITNFEVSMTGALNHYNSSATKPACARFATSAADGAVTCDWDGAGSGTSMPCGAPTGHYRVSEYDCNIGATSTMILGTGAHTDNIFVRFEVDRSRLGARENLMVVIEYAAANVNSAPADPTTCYNSTLSMFDPTQANCADQAWQIFLKKNGSDAVMPFLTLVPPAFSSIDSVKHRGGASVTTRQVILPIAGDPQLKLFQLSRMRAKYRPSFASGTRYCDNNSALCHGMVFYSVTIFRI